MSVVNLDAKFAKFADQTFHEICRQKPFFPGPDKSQWKDPRISLMFANRGQREF